MGGGFIKAMQFALTEYDCVSFSGHGDEEGEGQDGCPPSDDDIQALAFHSHVNLSLLFLNRLSLFSVFAYLNYNFILF